MISGVLRIHRVASAVHADEFSSEAGLHIDCALDAHRLPGKIRIESADDDARVMGRLPMQSDEVAAVQGEHASLFLRRKREHRVIGDLLIRPAGFRRRQHIMPMCAQRLDHRLWEILIRIEPRPVTLPRWLESRERSQNPRAGGRDGAEVREGDAQGLQARAYRVEKCGSRLPERPRSAHRRLRIQRPRRGPHRRRVSGLSSP